MAQATTENRTMVRKFEKLCSILEQFDRNPAKLIPILQAVQHEYRYLPQEVLTFVATSLALSPARVFGVATFYAHFALEPKGKYVIKLCNGTACYVKGSLDILDAIRKKLGLEDEQNTTGDMLFTVETVSCLGGCGLAPAVVVNDKVYGLMTTEKAVALVDEIIESEVEA